MAVVLRRPRYYYHPFQVPQRAYTAGTKPGLLPPTDRFHQKGTGRPEAEPRKAGKICPRKVPDEKGQ